ncbi:MAG TPA: type VI secretion system contractile sheath large subunit [Candidatus Competibacteraceae bacterium]|nr:type VI secretion system contractile sheath large subunit [Candidatus Competibacteraceae bacterium]
MGVPDHDATLTRSRPAAALELALEASLDQERLSRFLAEPDWARALTLWLGPGASRALAADRDALLARLDRDIARIDRLLTGQVNAILHHPRLQRLEASWRGLLYLVEQAARLEADNLRIRVLNVGWEELARDLERAIEFDQSQLFRKVYSEEFGMPGGEPFGVLIGDYAVRHRPGPGHRVDDVAALRAIAQVAAAAFAPFVAAADPALFGLDSLRELALPLELGAVFQQLEYLPWRSLRESEDARFVGLVLPRVLMRLPYADDGARADGFRFREDSEASGHYLWGNAVYAFAAVLLRAFAEHGWPADIRGVRDDGSGGGLVEGLPLACFDTECPGLAPMGSLEVLLGDEQERELAELGFITLCPCADGERVAFYSNPSLQRPAAYDTPVASANARLSAMLQYMLCVSRFGHYLKIIGRDKIGAFTGSAECENYLQRWLLDYTTASDDLSPELQSRYPLREAQVQVREHPGKPGSYLCIAHLRPHFQLEQVITAVRLVTELTPTQPT